MNQLLHTAIWHASQKNLLVESVKLYYQKTKTTLKVLEE